MTYSQQQPQQPAAVPFSDTLDASDAGMVPDGRYLFQLTRLETFTGTKYQSTEPQDKLRFVLTVLTGPQAGEELWNLENLPDVNPATGKRKPLGLKSGARKFIGLLRGRPLVDTEQINPSSLVGTQGQGIVAEGKITTFLPQQAQPMQQAPAMPQQAPPMQQPAQVQQPAVQQAVQPVVQPPADDGQQPPPQPQAPLQTSSDPVQQPTPQQAWQDTQQQAVERF